MISPSFSGCVDSSNSSRMKHGSASTQAPRTFMPFGKYADVGTQKIKTTHPDVRLHVGSASTLYLSKGTLLGKDITYISQVWNAWDAESTQMFYEQVLPYIDPETLRPLMGICVPTVISTRSLAAGRFTLAMELPHPTGWRSADPYISAELKEKIIIAYLSIHGRNVLHNDVKLENMLIGDDNKVMIVDFCKAVANPGPADLALEMRAVKFMLDYDGAKEAEYERLRRAESRAGKNFRRSWLRRAAENMGFGSEADHDERHSQHEIDFPPFTRNCLMKWDSEVVTEGTTHCPGWKGERLQVPEDMRSQIWPGMENYTPLSTPPHQPTYSVDLVKTAFDSNSSCSRGQRTKPCHYFPCLWSPVVESAESDPKKPIATCSSSTSPTDLSDYATGSEHNSTTGSEPSERCLPATPPFARERTRVGSLTRPTHYSRGDKRMRRSASPESFAKYQGNQTSWTTHRIERLGPPSPEPEPPTPSDLSSSPGKSSAGGSRSTIGFSRRRTSAWTDQYPTRRTLVTASPQRSYPPPESERCCVVVMDSDEEDKVWFMSREALRDVKGYLQVKKTMGAAIQMPSGRREGGVQHSTLPVERDLLSPSARLTRKRSGTPEDSDGEAQKPKRRRSWPEVDSYVFKPNREFLLCDS